MKRIIFPLCVAIPLLTSCLLNHEGLYTYHCEDAHFIFSIFERKDASVLILGNSDSIIYTPAMDGDYEGIAFYLLDSTNTIFIPRGLEFYQTDSDSIRGYFRARPEAVSYKIKSHKYKIKHLQQSVESLDFDYSVLGNNYWLFEGDINERGGGRYTFHYIRSNSNHVYPSLEPTRQ